MELPCCSRNSVKLDSYKITVPYYHLVLPHGSLRQLLDKPEPTRGSGSAKKWKQVTPAMAAGVADHVWSTSELLSFRLPAQFIDNMNDLEQLFKLLELPHQGR